MVKFAPLIDTQVRKRKKPVGNSWRMDETYIKVNGSRVYLYRAVDSLGNTIEGNASDLCFNKISVIVCYFKGNRDGVYRSDMRFMQTQ